MKKLFGLIVAMALVASFAVPAFASDSRVTALANSGNYLEDDYNIFDWPATLPSYSNMVWMSVHHYAYWPYEEMGFYPNYFTMIGASYGFGEDNQYGTLAMFFYNYGPPLNMYEGYDDVYSDPLPSKFHIAYAYPMESLSFGLYLSRADEYSSQTMDSDTEEDHFAYTTVGAGLRFNVGENAYGDVAFDVSFASYKYENTSWGTVENDANLKYGVRGRMFYEYNETVTFIPYFSYSAYDFRLKADSTDYADTHWGDKMMMINFGVGANVKVNEDNTLLFVVEPFDYMKNEPSQAPDTITDESTANIMPRFILALESDVKDWLTFRVGGAKTLVKWTDKSNEEGTYEETGTLAPFEFFMGLGFHVGDFDIDCVVNNDLPYHLGYWLTGYSWDTYGGPYKANGWGNEPIYMITGTYHF